MLAIMLHQLILYFISKYSQSLRYPLNFLFCNTRIFIVMSKNIISKEMLSVRFLPVHLKAISREAARKKQTRSQWLRITIINKLNKVNKKNETNK